jgi:hypothetical protein
MAPLLKYLNVVQFWESLQSDIVAQMYAGQGGEADH